MVGELFFQRRPDVAFQVRHVVWHEVRKVTVLGMAPTRLDGIQFWGIRRKPFEVDVLQSRLSDPFCCRTMDRPTVPADDQRPLNLLPQLPDEFDDFVGANVVGMDLEWCANPASHRRESDGADDAQAIIAVPGSLNRGCTARSPGATIHRLQTKARFIEKNDGGAASACFFLIRGQSRRRQRSTASASCSRATRLGFCGEKPRSCKIRRMWSRWYDTRNCLRTTSETRAQVHRSFRYPAAIGPLSRILTSDLRCSSESLHAGPGCGLAANPSTPSAFHVRCQRFTLVKVTPKSVAISRRGLRSWKYSAARRRRASSSAALPGVLIKQHTVLSPT